MRFPLLEPRHVLVTGCSSGIGRATARLLKSAGWQVIPTARSATDLDALVKEGFDAVRLDLADDDSVRRAAEEATARLGGPPAAIVNNAGFGQSGALEDLSRDALRYQFEVNLFGMQQLTNLLIPSFREAGRGRIVNVSSVLGRIAMPFNGAYSATKFAMEAFSDALRIELHGSGIAVSLVEPGPVATAFRKNAVERAGETLLQSETSRFEALYRREMDKRTGPAAPARPFTASPEAVARRIEHALTSPRPRRRYCVTPQAYAGAWMSRLAPYAVIDAVFRAALRSRM